LIAKTKIEKDKEFKKRIENLSQYSVKPITIWNLDNKVVRIFPSIKQITQELGICRKTA
jgi:NUMOD1 domain